MSKPTKHGKKVRIGRRRERRLLESDNDYTYRGSERTPMSRPTPTGTGWRGNKDHKTKR